MARQSPEKNWHLNEKKASITGGHSIAYVNKKGNINGNIICIYMGKTSINGKKHLITRGVIHKQVFAFNEW